MADVSRSERAQMTLVAALLVATTLVGMALILNSVIYTENLSTRATNAEPESALSSTADARDGLVVVLNEINVANGANVSHAALETRLDLVAANWSNTYAGQESTGAASTTVEVNSVSNGVRILQTDETRNFTAGGSIRGQATWRVVDSVAEDDLQRFVLNVSRKNLYSATFDTTSTALAESAFHVYVRDADGETWRVYVFEGSASESVYVLVEEPGENFQGSAQGYDDFVTDGCSTRLDNVVIRLEDAIVADHRCSALEFLSEDVDAPYEIWYNQTTKTDVLGNRIDRVLGRYELLLNRTTLDRTPYHSASDGSQPYTVTAISSATVDVTVRSASVTYSRPMRIRPQRFGQFRTGTAPVVESSTVTDQSTNTDHRFRVDWTVSDADGDLEEVEVVLSDESGNVHDRASRSETGSSASGTVTVNTLSLDPDSVYGIQVVVTDAKGISATVAERHTADGDDSGDPP